MTQEFIMQMRPWFGAEEKQALMEYMDEDGFLTEFKKTEAFEQSIADYTGAKHCVVVNNGTISLTLAAMAAGVEAGDEVIVPNYTMIATPNSLRMFGAVPVFVDVEPTTLCLDFALVEQAITAKTKAIVLVAANGRAPAVGIEAFQTLCEQRGIALIEDAAQGLGSYYPDGAHTGTKGLVGSFSFSAPKIISTGQGGALITNCDKTAEKLRRLKDFGRASGGNDIHDSLGFNFKFTELQAVVGLCQMDKLAPRVARKKVIWQQYADQLAGCAQVKLFDHDLSITTPWFIDVLVEQREALGAYLKSEMIGTRVMYPPITQQKVYGIEGSFPVAEDIGKNGLWLPSSNQLTDADISRICDAIKAFYA
ncbi:MAG: DegT/DnrJ/EryC1/StrS family aminotransferase [Gammaproteobacteria bacterium]|nr:DegT/DnrJ/EryC1/StrS family aminotransferase [Gammaproteobacteria bacterium]